MSAQQLLVVTGTRHVDNDADVCEISGMRRVIRASEDHRAGVVHWGLNISPSGFGCSPLELAYECHPESWVGWITYSDGTEERISPAAFGTVTKLSDEENGLVAAGGELLEFEERSPTLAECREQADTAVRAPLLTA